MEILLSRQDRWGLLFPLLTVKARVSVAVLTRVHLRSHRLQIGNPLLVEHPNIFLQLFHFFLEILDILFDHLLLSLKGLVLLSQLSGLFLKGIFFFLEILKILSLGFDILLDHSPPLSEFPQPVRHALNFGRSFLLLDFRLSE